MDVDNIQNKLMSNCRFQILAFICLGLIYGRGAWNLFGTVFLIGKVSYKCDLSQKTPALEPNFENLFEYTSSSNSSVGESDCEVVFPAGNGTNVTKQCTSGWVYSSEFVSTIVSEWDLVCSRAYLSDLSTILFMVGSMLGALLIAPLSDKFGRRLILLLSLLAQAVVGVCVALSTSYAAFTALRFIVGFFNMGISLTVFVMLTEIFPTMYRTIPCCGFQIFWAFGIMFTAFLGFVIREWHYLQLAFSLPNLLFAVFIWFLPESLPWLISQRSISKAHSVIERIARFNGIDPPIDLYQSADTYDDNCNISDMANHHGGKPLLSGNAQLQESLLGNLPLKEALSGNSTLQETLPGNLQIQELDLSYGSSYSQESHKIAFVETTKICLDGDYKASCTEAFIRVTPNEERKLMLEVRKNTMYDLPLPASQLLNPVVPVDEVLVQVKVSSNNTCITTSLASDVTEHDSSSLSSVFVLCQGSRIRLYSIVIFYLFFVNSLSYVGISLSIPILHGDQFLNLFLLGAVEVPAYIICVLVCDRFGRKIPLCVFMLLCGVMNIIAALLSEKANLIILHVICVMLGKFAITGSYTTVYLYSAEIFPTSIRNFAMGMSSFFENLGGIAAPFIVFSAKSIPILPMILFGVVSIIGGVVLIVMPETHRQPMPQTTKELEAWNQSSTTKK